MSFLDKLKNKIEQENAPIVEAPKENKTPADFIQLDVDIYENSSEIIIYAPVPGAEIEDLDISVGNENDAITIQGKNKLPTGDVKEKNQCLRQECRWGGFYRQIILPSEININEVDAKLKKGILVLRLPLLRIIGKGGKKITVKSDEAVKE